MAEANTIPETMKALQLIEFNKPYRLNTVPVPKPRPNEVLVRIHAASFCHTDYQVYTGTYRPKKLPHIGSHEPAGVIAAVGSGVSSKWTVGTRVGVLLHSEPCGKCSPCRWAKRDLGHLESRFCENRNAAGIARDGGFAEFMIIEAYSLVKLPDGLAFEQAAPLMCAGVTVYSAVKRVNRPTKSTIGILGIGGLGLLGVQFAKAIGYRVVAIDNNSSSLENASKLKDSLRPDLTVDSSDTDHAKKLVDGFTDNIGLSALVSCTDFAPVVNWGLKLLQPHGILVPLGLPEKGYNFDPFTFVFKEITIQGSLHGSAENAEELVNLVHKFGIQSTLTPVTLDDAENIIERVEKKDFNGRIVVTI